MPAFYEFFAGGGMARAGLGQGWDCRFANDFDPMKAAAYRANWPGNDFVLNDIATLTPADLPGQVDLAWASSPCQDLSLAGKNGGLGTAEAAVYTRSGTFWHFWRLMQSLDQQGRPPKSIVLENVCGTITSNAGADFRAIINAFVQQGYKVGAVVIDAALFLPHSRKRVFIVGIREGVPIPQCLVRPIPSALWHPTALQKAYAALPPQLQASWLWWHLPAPTTRQHDFIDLLEPEPTGVKWHSPAETTRLLSLMGNVHLQKVQQAAKVGHPVVGGVYRRMRLDGEGKKMQRAEVRFDRVAGCLRTGSGGSSKQLLLLVDGQKIRSRLLAPREAARLMGLPDTYILPTNYGDAYHLAGDGVAVPAVRYLAAQLLEPILTQKPALVPVHSPFQLTTAVTC